MSRLVAALIRHGDYHQLKDTPSAYQPFPLNKNGEQQSRQLATKITNVLAEQQWTLAEQIDSSNLLRAYQTAALLKQQLTLPNLKHCGFDVLAERSVGASCANLTNTQIMDVLRQDPRYPELPEDWKSNSYFSLPFEGAESLLDAGKRVATHLNLSMSAMRFFCKQDTLKVFVGHGAAFRHAAHHLGILEFDDIAKLSMYHCEPVYLELLPNNRWQHIAGGWKVREKQNQYTD
ncbi:MAG: hypothetical protein GQ569_06685 [Methylococcaceae bacterium]|nr:hypothetical protein [Methylococcaceae bacterium]